MFEIVGKDSPLRRLPEALELRQQFVLDGMRCAAETVGLCYFRLVATLADFVRRERGSETPFPFVEAFADAWSVVDATNRLRKLITMFQGARDTRGIADFLAHTEAIADVRNAGQHMHNRVDRFVKKKEHAWGSITWISLDPEPPHTCLIHLAAPGFLYSDETHPFDNAVGKMIKGPIDHVILHAYEKKIRFAEVVAAVRTVVELLEAHIRQQFAGLPTGGSDLYARAEFTSDEPTRSAADCSEPDG